MKTLITLIFCLFVGCGKSDNKGNVVDDETFVHTNQDVSVRLKDVLKFEWEEKAVFSASGSKSKIEVERDEGFSLVDRQGKFIGRVSRKEEIAKIRKYIGKD